MKFLYIYVSTHLHILNKKQNHQVRKYQCTWNPSQEKLDQSMFINETAC